MFYGTGINLYNINNNALRSRHAEVSAALSLKRSDNKRKVNVFVFRTNNMAKCQMAKPCDHCIHSLYKLCDSKNYTICRIYYTDWDGNVVKL